MTAIPALFPPPSGQTWRPWLTPAMFRAFPTWLDTDDLVQNAQQTVQDDALSDVLFAATDWAVGELGEMRLDGHLVSGETGRARVLPTGRVTLMPRDIPLRAIISLSVGPDPASLSAVTLPDPSMTVTAGGKVVSLSACSLLGSSSVVPSFRARRGGDLYYSWSYVAGFPNALLSAVAKGDNSVTVDDPAGILPGEVLRIWDPGISESLTVASTYVPAVPTIPPTSTSIPLAAATAQAHAAGTGISGFPRKALQAVIAYAVALLMREDVSGEEPASGFGPDARTTAGTRGGIASGLVNDAYGWLNPYRQYVRGR